MRGRKRKEDLAPSVRTGDVVRRERGGQAVAILVEGEERMAAGGLEVAIGGRLLLAVSGHPIVSHRGRGY